MLLHGGGGDPWGEGDIPAAIIGMVWEDLEPLIRP
jgi:hypothetical protein